MPRRVHREGIKDEGAIKDENAIPGNDEQARFWRKGIEKNAAYMRRIIELGGVPKVNTEITSGTPTTMHGPATHLYRSAAGY